MQEKQVINQQIESYSENEEILLAAHSNQNGQTKRIVDSWKRWVFLFCVCFANFGSYACYDNPQMLEKHIKEQLKIDSSQYSLLYQVYSMPNLILPFIGGFLMDKFGIRIIIVASSALITIGQIVFVIGGAKENLDIMIAGRVLFGFGGESLFIGAVSWIAKWFRGKELMFAQGCNTFMSFMGNSYNSFFTPIIFKWKGDRLWPPLFAAAIFAMLSTFSAIVAAIIDKRADRERSAEEVRIAGDKITLKDIKILSKNVLFWLLIFNIYISSQNFFGLTSYLNDYLMARFGLGDQVAGRILSLMYLIIAVCAPIAGYLVDLKGHQALLMIISNIVFLIAHITLGFLPNGKSDYLCMLPISVIGLTMSVWQTLVWVAIPKVVEKSVVGASIGLCDMFQNVGFFVQPFLYGYVIDHTRSDKFGYFWLSFCFMVTSTLGALCSFCIFAIDRKQGKRL